MNDSTLGCVQIIIKIVLGEKQITKSSSLSFDSSPYFFFLKGLYIIFSVLSFTKVNPSFAYSWILGSIWET